MSEQLNESLVLPVLGECDFVGQRYTIRTVTDLYMLPESKLEHCLLDVAASIKLHQQFAKVSGMDCRPLEEIEWVDDGKHDLAMRVVANAT